MKSKYEIEMNFQDAVNQAQALEEASAGLAKIAGNNIPWALSAIASSWRGENAAAYIGKGEKMSDEIMSLADNLYSVAREIRFTAGAIYKAEIAALNCIPESLW